MKLNQKEAILFEEMISMMKGFNNIERLSYVTLKALQNIVCVKHLEGNKEKPCINCPLNTLSTCGEITAFCSVYEDEEVEESKEGIKMVMFQINIKEEYKGHLFNSISQAYAWVCQNVMTKGDKEYYKSIGNKIPLYQIQNENIQEVVLRNAFEKICFSGWNDKVDTSSPHFIIHE